MASARFACVLVSHDRYFLENVTTSMAELNRLYPDGLFRAAGPYSAFLEKRADFQVVQSKLEVSLQTKVTREIEWLRRGAKARTTKSKARIDEAHRLIGALADVSDRRKTGVARMALEMGVTSSCLHAVFREVFELTPQAWLGGARLRQHRCRPAAWPPG